MTIFMLIFSVLTSIIFLYLMREIHKMRGISFHKEHYAHQTSPEVIMSNLSEKLKHRIFTSTMWPVVAKENVFASYSGMQKQIQNMEKEELSLGLVWYWENACGRLTLSNIPVINKDGIWYTQDDL